MKVKSMKIRQMEFRQVRKAAFLFIAAMASFSVQAQDTTSLKEVKDERVIDSLENLLLEGEYGKSVSADFTFSRFTLKKKGMYVHGSGASFGGASLASRNLSDAGWVEDAILKSGFECDLTFLGLNARLSKKYGWFVYGGLGMRAKYLLSESNGAFKIEDKRMVQVFPKDEVVFSSNLSQVYVHIPVLIEYQKKVDKNDCFFFQLGADIGVNFIDKIRTKYINTENARVKEVIKIRKYVNPITVELKAEIGFNDFGFYFKYGLIDVFKKGHGPEVIPFSAGIIVHF